MSFKLALDNLEVRYQNQTVGYLNWLKDKDICEFIYDRDFIKTGIELSPIMMPLSKEVYIFDQLDRRTYKGLPPMIVDSLPDKFGNIIFSNYLASKNIVSTDINTLFRLSYIGQRGAGAIEYFPANKEYSTDELLNMNEIKKLINDIYDKKFAINQDFSMTSNEALEQLMQFGGSPGGARAKMVIAMEKDNLSPMAGDAPPRSGLDYYLLKLNTNAKDSDNKQWGKLEFAYYQMAKDSGLKMMDSFLWQDEHFCTKRFDRDNKGNKFHYQTFNAMFGADWENHYTYSYENFFNHLKSLNVPQEDNELFFKQMCFNVILSNRDDHTKNFAMILKDNQWRYAPAYDLCFSYKSNDAWIGQNSLAINGKRNDITVSDLLKVGKNYYIKNPMQIINQIIDVASKFLDYTDLLDMPRQITKPMSDFIQNQAVFQKDKI